MAEMGFPKLVKSIRQARGQTQEELARELDVTVGTMNGWENGKHRPVRAQRRKLIAIAEHIGISVPKDCRV